MRRLGLVCLLLLMGSIIAIPVASGMYRWTDENGDPHISSRIEDIPERFRKDARQVTAPGPASDAKCAGLPGEPKGGGRVPFSLDKAHMIVAACVNGRGPIRLIVDTGAGRTFVSQRFLEEIGVKVKDAPDTVVGGLGGMAAAKRVMVRSVQVGGARLGPMEIVAHDLGFNVDGLIGQDFMSKFVLDVDNQRGVLTLTPR